MRRSTTQVSRTRSIRKGFCFVFAALGSVLFLGGCLDEPAAPAPETQLVGYKPPSSIQGFLPNIYRGEEALKLRLKGKRLQTWVLRFPTGLRLSRSEERETTERRVLKILSENHSDRAGSQLLDSFRKEFQKVELLFEGEAPIIHPEVIDHRVVDSKGRPICRIFSTLDSTGRTKISWSQRVANITQYVIRSWTHPEKRIRLTVQFGTLEQDRSVQMAEAIVQVADDRPPVAKFAVLPPSWRGLKMQVRSDVVFVPNGAHTAENLLGHLQELTACYPNVVGPFSPVILDSVEEVPGVTDPQGLRFEFKSKEFIAVKAQLPPFDKRSGLEVLREAPTVRRSSAASYGTVIVIAPNALTQSVDTGTRADLFGKAIEIPNFMKRFRERQRNQFRPPTDSIVPIPGRGGGR